MVVVAVPLLKRKPVNEIHKDCIKLESFSSFGKAYLQMTMNGVVLHSAG